MVKVLGTDVYANNILIDRNEFILIKSCKTKEEAKKFAKLFAKNNKDKTEENDYELI